MKSPVSKVFLIVVVMGEGSEEILSISIIQIYYFPILTVSTVLVRGLLKYTLVSNIVFVVHLNRSRHIKIHLGIYRLHNNLKISMSYNNKVISCSWTDESAKTALFHVAENGMVLLHVRVALILFLVSAGWPGPTVSWRWKNWRTGLNM